MGDGFAVSAAYCFGHRPRSWGMVDSSALIDLERRFWHGDATFYDATLTEDAVMVFPPPTGVLDRAAVIDSLGAADRWRSVDFRDDRLVGLGEDAVQLVYRAEAVRRADGSEYAALVTSTYVREDDWRLASHQQTPIEE